MKKVHEIKNIKINNDSLIITIDGKENSFQLEKISPKLYKANELEKNNFEISPSGYGIHWPLIDEDLSIDGLLGIIHSIKTKDRIRQKCKKNIA